MSKQMPIEAADEIDNEGTIGSSGAEIVRDAYAAYTYESQSWPATHAARMLNGSKLNVSPTLTRLVGIVARFTCRLSEAPH